MAKSCVSCIFFTVVVIAVSASAVYAQRAIPVDHLAMPVLITLGNGDFGSGFYLETKDAVYLVTAKHVLFDPKTEQLVSDSLELLSYSIDPSEMGSNRVSVDLKLLQANGGIKPHPSEDVVVVKLFIPTIVNGNPMLVEGRRTFSAQQGVLIRATTKKGLQNVGLDAVATFDKVQTGNDVIVFGYPNSLALQQLHQLDPNRPLLRKGMVAGTNQERRSIILDCPVYFGNCGGPVLEIDKTDAFRTDWRIIGVVSQYVPFIQTAGSQTVGMQIMSNSGYSIATPMDFVLELIK